MRALSVASMIRRAVSAGQYAPGAKLNEVATAERLGVSRNTLREGFALLDADGIIDRVPNRGVFIATPTPESVRDLYRAREIVEPAALRWGRDLDSAALDAMDGAVHSAETALVDGDFTAVGLGNQKFHRAVVAAAGSALLDEEVERLLARMRLVFLLAERANAEFHRPFVAVNRTITDLAMSGDREAAADRLRESITSTGSDLEHLVTLFRTE
ncbi:GntR family transcriptional regulator [Corynebacterium nuruki]|jgi:DNA-binding GntR family transcriptional regulator|uniref:GntR family transcriptional regulator n=1 Tax=Corynebacterium nuruki TaxID=1032851 RepID=UPI0039BF3637